MNEIVTEKPEKKEQRIFAEECPEMARLRKELDARGVDWWDESDELSIEEDGCEHGTVWVITKWYHHGELVSVAWDYMETRGERRGVTYGWPDLLECWYKPNNPEPQAMTVEEILEACA